MKIVEVIEAGHAARRILADFRTAHAGGEYRAPKPMRGWDDIINEEIPSLFAGLTVEPPEHQRARRQAFRNAMGREMGRRRKQRECMRRLRLQRQMRVARPWPLVVQQFDFFGLVVELSAEPKARRKSGPRLKAVPESQAAFAWAEQRVAA